MRAPVAEIPKATFAYASSVASFRTNYRILSGKVHPDTALEIHRRAAAQQVTSSKVIRDLLATQAGRFEEHAEGLPAMAHRLETGARVQMSAAVRREVANEVITAAHRTGASRAQVVEAALAAALAPGGGAVPD